MPRRTIDILVTMTAGIASGAGIPAKIEAAAARTMHAVATLED